MAISLVGSAEASENSASSLTLSVPAGGKIGDVLLAHVSAARGATSPFYEFVAPAGWTDLGFVDTGPATGSNPFVHVFQKIHGSSEPSSYDFDLDSTGDQALVGHMMCWRGVLPQGLTGAASDNNSGGSAGDPVAPSVTTVEDNEVVVFVGCQDNDEAPATEANYYPAGTTGIQVTEDAGGGSDNGLALGSAYQLYASPSSTGTKTFNSDSNEEWCGASYRLLPVLPPAFESVTSTTSSSANTSHSISMPSTRPDGDLYIMHASVGDPVTFTAPSGWTEIDQRQDSSNAVSSFVAYRYGDSEPSSYTLTLSASEGIAAQVIRISGASPTVPVHASVYNDATSTTATYLSLTTDIDNCILLGLSAWDGNKGLGTFRPTGWTQIGKANIGGATPSTSRASYLDLPTAGATSSATEQGTTNDQWVTSALAIPPEWVEAPSLAPDPVAVPIAAQAPSVVIDVAVSPGATAVPIAAPAPSVDRSLSVSPGATPVPIAVPDPAVALELSIAADPVAVPIVAPNPSAERSLELLPDPAAVPLVVAAPSVDVLFALAPDPVAVPVVPPAPAVDLDLALSPDPVAVPVVGVAPQVQVDTAIAPDPAQVAVVAPAPQVVFDATINGDPVQIQILSVAPLVDRQLQIAPDATVVPVETPNPAVSLELAISPDPADVVLVVRSVAVAGADFAARVRIIDRRGVT